MDVGSVISVNLGLRPGYSRCETVFPLKPYITSPGSKPSGLLAIRKSFEMIFPND